MGFGQANTMEGEKDKGSQGISKGVIITMELVRERNEVVRRVIEKRW